MKLSELTVEQAMAYAVVSDDAPDAALFQGYLESAKNYALEYTGLDASAADSKPGTCYGCACGVRGAGAQQGRRCRQRQGKSVA